MPDDNIYRDKAGKPIPLDKFDNDVAPSDKPPKPGDDPVSDWLRDRIEQHKPQQ